MPKPSVTGPSQDPDVTVVVICFNDRANLPRAVRSVTAQTLRNLEIIVVDDASTDGSAEVADELAREDPRISVVRLPENSGGCSRPRNTGLDLARGRYVMFLDSDDYFDRHACKIMLLAAERTGAEVVGAGVVRENLTKDKLSPWAKDIYDRRAVYAGISENPMLFFDPLSTNKIYRADFLARHGIRFPEGIHYEDSYFSTMVYCLAESIGTVPNVIYHWQVVQDAAEDASITQRRHEFENFRDRVAVHRLMDAFLAEHGHGDLKPWKDFKFVRHDLKLYLHDLAFRDDDYQQRFMALAAEYLATVSDEALAHCYPLERICVDLIRRGDLPEVLKAVEYLRYNFKLASPLVVRDGRAYWTAKYLDTPADRAVMDVTEMNFHRLPFGKLPLYNRVVAASVVGSRLTIEGRVLNQLGVLNAEDDLRVQVSVRVRGLLKGRVHPVRDWSLDADFLTYRTEIDLARALTPVEAAPGAWDLRLEIVRDGVVSVSPFSIDPRMVAGNLIRVRHLVGSAPAQIEPYVTYRMNLAFQQVEDTGLTAVADDGARLLRRARHSVKWRTSKAVGNNPAVKAFGYKLLRRLPVRKGLAVFESHMGRQYSDSPRYIYEAAVAAGLRELDLKPVWSYTYTKRGFPQDCRLVKRDSWRYLYDLARAEFWVDNQGLPRMYTRRRETTYIQTWHGTPLKRMGFDSPALERASAATRRVHKAMMRRWSALLVPSEYFVETFVKSYGYEGRLVRKGLPRNDLLVRGASQEWLDAKKRELGLPQDRRLVLYCPTFRDRARRLTTPYDLAFDIEAMRRALGDDVFLLLRPHYLDRLKLSDRYLPFAADLSRHHDVTELMLLADVLVTDYSSVMFDFANTGKPMVFFTYDYEDYVRDERGTYVDLPDIAPGPIVETTDALIEALRAVDDSVEKYAETYAEFRERFCEFETGRAAEAVVDEFFRGRS